MDINEFLRARISEDEVCARAALEGEGGQGVDCREYFALLTDRRGMPPSSSTPQEGAARRLLAECAAKRAMIGFAGAAGMMDQTLVEMDYGWADAGPQILQSLASVYAHHPEYQGEWSA